MDLFDDLPAAVRCALACAGFPFHPRAAIRFLRHGHSAEQVAAVIVAVDRRLSRLSGVA